MTDAIRDVRLHDPQTLYRHWEDSQWNPFEIELGADREQWPQMTGEDRGLVLWALSSLMVAEERITTKFSGLVGAYGSEEEAAFLATQQRHIGYGVWFLREALREDPALADGVRETLRGLLPAVAESLTPPDRDGNDWEALGASAEEIRAFALDGLTRRLKIIGVPLETL